METTTEIVSSQVLAVTQEIDGLEFTHYWQRGLTWIVSCPEWPA